MHTYDIKNGKLVPLVVSHIYEDGKLSKIGGFMTFHIDMDSVESTVDKLTNRSCFIAYGLYNKTEEGFWIVSYTKDMSKCYSICKEGETTVYECNNRCILAL